MERQLLLALYRFFREICDPGKPAGCQFSDFWILLAYAWSVICDRPVSWACPASNWPEELACFTPPSPSTMSRRLHRPSALWLLVHALVCIHQRIPAARQHYIDSRPLCVGGSSTDRDARIGWGAGRMAKGYKLHVIVQNSGRLDALAVLPMNRNDTSAAPALLEAMGISRGYLIGDTAYDADRLYDMAAVRGMQLVATPRVRKKGLGHKRHSPHRLRGLSIAQSPEGHRMLRDRFFIDRQFGTWGNIAGGLWGLPNFVRHLETVRRWVVTKIMLIGFRLLQENKHLRQR